MRTLNTDVAGRVVTDFGSNGFSVSPVAGGSEVHVVILRLAADGRIARHLAAGMQLLVLLEGQAAVSGESGDSIDLLPGQAVIWDPGESHETTSTTGMTALAVEGDLELLLE